MEGGSRRRALLAVLCFIALGVPAWWHLTRIQRPALAHGRMQAALSEVQAGVGLPVTITLHLLCDDLDAEDPVALARHLWEALDQIQEQQRLRIQAEVLQAQGGSCSLASWPPTEAQPGRGCLMTPDDAAHFCKPGLSPEAAQAAWDAHMERVSPPGSYHIAFAVPGVGPSLSLVIGQHRGAVLQLPLAGKSSRQQLLQAIESVAPALSAAFLSTAARSEAAPGQLPLSAAGEAILSFSLCNADSAAAAGPEAGAAFYSWAFESFERQYLAPFIKAVRSSCAVRMSVESQVLLYAPSKEGGVWSEEHGGYAVKQSRLASFVDGRWGLNTGSNALPDPESSASEPSELPSELRAAPVGIPPHVLHFLAYVPHRSRRPLLVLQPDGGLSATNSFWIPSWGGVHVINPHPAAPDERNGEDCARADEEEEQEPELPGARARNASEPLGEREMQRFAGVVVSQLRALLGVDLRERLLEQHQLQGRPAGVQPFELRVLPVPLAGISTWELDALTRRVVASNAQAAAEVLGSLSRLVDQLPTLEMPDLIGDQVEAALVALHSSLSAVRFGRYTEAAVLAQRVRREAEAAFSNPSVLAQLSFPPSHAIGVYVPFFLPVAMVLLQAIIGEITHSRLRRTGSKAEGERCDSNLS